MTCVIGLVQDGKIYMGADSQASDGWNKRTVARPKVFKTDRFLIGYTSSFRMGQLLQYQLEVQSQNSESDYIYMATTVVESVRHCLKKHGWSKVENNQEEIGSFLVGYNGGLYEIQPDLSILEHTDGFDAVGVGREYALGAMMALEEMPPKARICQALEIVAMFSNGVSAPFTVLEGPAWL